MQKNKRKSGEFSCLQLSCFSVFYHHCFILSILFVRYDPYYNKIHIISSFFHSYSYLYSTFFCCIPCMPRKNSTNSISSSLLSSFLSHLFYLRNKWYIPNSSLSLTRSFASSLITEKVITICFFPLNIFPFSALNHSFSLWGSGGLLIPTFLHCLLSPSFNSW